MRPPLKREALASKSSSLSFKACVAARTASPIRQLSAESESQSESGRSIIQFGRRQILVNLSDFERRHHRNHFSVQNPAVSLARAVSAVIPAESTLRASSLPIDIVPIPETEKPVESVVNLL